jgi:spore germination cell wall hydrolase CwlJ-like protein
MFDKILLRAITFMLIVTMCSFVVMFSYEPKIKNEVTELPIPKIYTAEDVEILNNQVVVEKVIVKTEENVIYINKEEYNCLVKNIYFEARNQPLEGKKAIAVVTLERVKHDSFPKTICGVVTQKRRGVCQFSWVCQDKELDLDKKEEYAAWERAMRVAEDALVGRFDPMLQGATHFHADYVSPYWSRKLKRITKIGDHIFYKEV